MWEEHPWYQKQQARTIGLFILALLAFNFGYAIIEREGRSNFRLANDPQLT